MGSSQGVGHWPPGGSARRLQDGAPASLLPAAPSTFKASTVVVSLGICPPTPLCLQLEKISAFISHCDYLGAWLTRAVPACSSLHNVSCACRASPGQPASQS